MVFVSYVRIIDGAIAYYGDSILTLSGYDSTSFYLRLNSRARATVADSQNWSDVNSVTITSMSILNKKITE